MQERAAQAEWAARVATGHDDDHGFRPSR